MKVVLIEVIPGKNVMTMNLVPPLGLGYIASVLESEGHKVAIVDGVRYSGSLDEALRIIISKEPDVVGFTATSQARTRAMELIKMVKKATGALTVAGGPHFHPTAKGALEFIPELDVVVKAEGEYTMRDLVQAHAKGTDFDKVKGLFFRQKDGVIRETEERPVIQDLDSLPYPAYGLFALKNYSCLLAGSKIPAIGVVSSRGCPNNCIFCANRVLRKTTLRLRSPVKFVDEIEFLKKEYGYRAFDFWDDTLTMSRPHIDNICKELLKRDLDIKWFARARVNTVDNALLRLMKDAGCQEIAYGVESGSDRILAAIHKGISVRQSEEAVRSSAELGLRVSAYFIVSLPGETIEDIKLTAGLIKQFKRYPNVHSYYCFSIIYPGTDLERTAREEGVIPEGFSWYKPCLFERNRIAGNDTTLPCYESRELRMEQIKAVMLQSDSSTSVLKKALRRLLKIRSLREIKDMATFGFKHLFPITPKNPL